MQYNDEGAETVLNFIRGILDEDSPAPLRVLKIWHGMAGTRSQALMNGLRQATGARVIGGPFKGMRLTEQAMAYFLSPIILGCYEHELHAMIEKAIAANYDTVVNIGCSVGYYAVGLALRMPHARIEAFDLSEQAQKECAEMAALNQIGDRLRIAGEFRGEDFAAYAGKKTLVLMDIESAEKDLLDPARFPALQKMDIIVEMHDLMIPGLSNLLSQRFATTHETQTIPNEFSFLPDLSELLAPGTTIPPIDHLLMGWENREGPTPWGIFTKKPG